jgi:VanZ family protein
MNEVAEQSPHWSSRWRWVIWLLFVLAWSTALLVPDPVGFVFGHGDGSLDIPDDVKFLMAKSLHVTAYALAAILTGSLHAPGRWRWVLLAFWSLHACGTEIGQLFVPTRTGSVRDVVLDHVGLLIGLALSWRWWRSGS